MPDLPNPGDSRDSLESFRNGHCGVDFDVLCRFARPIFELFGFDISSVTNGLSDEQVEDHVAALETARLFWAFFESGGYARTAPTMRLQSVLFGPDPSMEEQAAMSVLVERLSGNWQVLPLKLREVGPNRPSFEALMSELEGTGFGVDPMGSPQTNGRNHSDQPVESPEALAAFASPLLDDPSIDDDPDRLSEMMIRAQDYWQLSTMTGDAFRCELERLADKHANCPDDKPAILAEANIMVARFHKLFPHWT